MKRLIITLGVVTCITTPTWGQSKVQNFDFGWKFIEQDVKEAQLPSIIRKTKCFRILERNAKISKTKRNFSRLYPTPQKFKKIDRLRRNEIHLKAVRTSS